MDDSPTISPAEVPTEESATDDLKHIDGDAPPPPSLNAMEATSGTDEVEEQEESDAADVEEEEENKHITEVNLLSAMDGFRRMMVVNGEGALNATNATSGDGLLSGFIPLRPFLDDLTIDGLSHPDGPQLSNELSFEVFRMYAQSDLADKREMAARHLPEVLRGLGNAYADIQEEASGTYDECLFLLEELLCDVDSVQVVALEQMKEIFMELRKISAELFQQANNNFPPLITRSLGYSNKVQIAAIDAIAGLIENDLLSREVVTGVIVPSMFDHVLDLNTISESDAERWFTCRESAVLVLGRIARDSFPHYPKRWAFEEFVPRFSTLFNDTNPTIRKISLQALGPFARCFGRAFTEQCLVPHLERAVRDGNAAVRKLCSEVIAEVSSHVGSKVRSEMLTPGYLRLLQDPQQDVYQAAIGQIGRFISTFADPSRTGVELRNGKLVPFVTSPPAIPPVPSLMHAPDSPRSSASGPSSDDGSGESGYQGTSEEVTGMKSYRSFGDLRNLSEGSQPTAVAGDGAGGTKTNEAECDYSKIPPGFVMPTEIASRQQTPHSHRVFEFKRDTLNGSYNSGNTDESCELDDHEASFIDGGDYGSPIANDVGGAGQDQCHDDQLALNSESDEFITSGDFFDEWERATSLLAAGAGNSSDYFVPRSISTIAKASYLLRGDREDEFDERSRRRQRYLNLTATLAEEEEDSDEDEDERRNDGVDRANTGYGEGVKDDHDEMAQQQSSSSQPAERESLLSTSITYWSFGDFASVEEGELKRYQQKSEVSRRKRMGLATTAATLPCTSQASSDEDSGGGEAEDGSEPSLERQVEVEAQRSQKTQSPTFQYAPQQQQSVSPVTGTGTPSSYWQKRLDFLHRSVQSVMQHQKESVVNSLFSKAEGSLQQLHISPKSIASSRFTVHTLAEGVGALLTGASGGGGHRQLAAATSSPPSAFHQSPQRRNIPAKSAAGSTSQMSGRGDENASLAPPQPSPPSTRRLSGAELARHYLTSEESDYVLEKGRDEQDVIPHELLERLWCLESHGGGGIDCDEENGVTNRIAQNMPAIVYTFGSGKWLFIKGFYLSLVHHYQARVRETIAHSLHEIAAIIGTRHSDRDLVPVFEKFLNDAPAVQHALLRHLYDFIKILSTSRREELVGNLSQLVGVYGKETNYRLRAEFARQLTLLVRLFNVNQVNCYLSPYALTFATDRIAEVRTSGVEMLAAVLSFFIRSEWPAPPPLHAGGERVQPQEDAISPFMPLTLKLLREIRAGFWHTRTWRRRQSFARMLNTLLAKRLVSDEQFLHLLGGDLIEVSEDEVTNVRQFFCTAGASLLRRKNHDKGGVAGTGLERILRRMMEMAANEVDSEILRQAGSALAT